MGIAACLLVCLAPRARAGIPVPEAAVERALEEVARAPAAATSYARALALMTALDALAPERQRAWLDRLAALDRVAPLLAARARFERLAYADPPAAGLAELGLVTDALVVYGDDPLTAAAPAFVGPRGALALEPGMHVASGRDRARVAFGLCPTTRADVVLRLGASGDVTVALDDRVLGHADDLGRAALDQLEVPLALEPGRRALVVVVRASGREPATLRARLTDRRGRALSHLACAPAAPAPVASVEGDARGPELRAPAAVHALAAPWRPLALRLLGHPGQTSALAGAIEEHAARLGPTLSAIAIAALPTPEARLTIATNLPRASTLVEASLAADRGQLVRARDRLAAEPDSPVRRVVMARVLREAGAPEDALGLLGAATSEAALLERARAALAAGWAATAEADLSALLAVISPERIDLHAMRVRALIALGRPADAVRASADLARSRPDRPALALEAAERALYADDPATAAAMVALARPLIAWRPDALVAAARIEGALGRAEAGRELARRALTIEPAHEDARRWLEEVAGTEPAPLTITATAELARAPALDPEAPWEVMAEELVVRLADDGSATKWLRRILRAQHPPAEREGRTFSWRFDPSQESVRVLGARVLDPDGRVTHARERHIRTAAEDWYNLYFDVRVLEIPFERLTPGALVEVTLRIDPVGQHFPGVFELVEVLRDRVPKHRHRIVVDAPRALELRSAVLGGGGRAGADGAIVEEARAAGAEGREVLALEATRLEALPQEPLAPGAAESSPVWQVTTFSSWPEVGRWYGRLLAAQVAPTADMRAEVAAIRAAEGGDAGRMTRALVALVRDHVRYVGLEFGIHGYKPYRTDDVWARRFGDCKDQALLLRTLLSMADIPAEVALVRTRGHGRIAGALPSLALFDHAIVHLPERGMFVDSTVIHHGMDELPAADQGAQVLVITDDAELASTPVDAPTRNQVVGVYSVTLDPDGGGGIQGTVAFHGAQAPPYRAALADPATQLDRLQAVLNRRYPGLVLDGARLSDPEDVDRPFEMVFHATVPRLASVIGDTLHVLRPAGIDGQGERLGSMATRTQALVPGPPMTFDLTFRYVLPSGFAVRELPRGGAAEGAFGRWSVTWTAEPGVITVATTLQWAVDQIGASDYPALRSFVRAFDAAVGAALVLERRAP